MPVELTPKMAVLDSANPMRSDDYPRLQNYAPGDYAARHGELHAQQGLFVIDFVCHRDPGAGATLTLPYDCPFPLKVLSAFCSIGTVPATSVTMDIRKGGTTILSNGPVTFANAGGNNQKATVEEKTGPSTVRLNPNSVNFDNNAAMTVLFTQNGAGTLIDARMKMLCQRRFS